jgi:putative ABC transport system substrate-binding protein
MVAGSAVWASAAVRAQPAGKVWRIGFLSSGFPPVRGTPDPADALWQRLRELGYVEHANLLVESRFAEWKPGRFPELAAELVRLNPDIIVTRSSPANLAGKNATSTIPIVMASGLDPVREGIVASIARPGGNVTGMMFASDTNIIAKRLQILKEAIPRLSRLAIVAGTSVAFNAGWVRDTEAAAKTLGVQVVRTLEVQEPSKWGDAFAGRVEGRAEAVYLIEAPVFIARGKDIADLALKHRLPTMFGAREHVEAGGLMSYGLNIPAVFRRAAELVDKVLKGAKPADMPIEQPTKYELVINLKTAKALGIAVPGSIVARADEVIQ